VSVEGTHYYIRVRGKIHGPFDVERLRKLQARGQFSRAHEVSLDKRSWQAAGSIKELFAANEPPPAPTSMGENVFLPMDASGEGISHGDSGPPESTKWYYNIGDERHGPVSLMDLRQLVLNGQLTPHDLVWKDGMVDWAPAGTLPELQFVRMDGVAESGRADGIGSSRNLPRMSGLAISSLTLGILGILLGSCTFGVCNIMAIVFGAVALRDVGRSRGLVTGRGMALSGLILGIIGASLWLVWWILIWLHILTMPIHPT